jgi:PRTRC genetic system ThiF family protein
MWRNGEFDHRRITLPPPGDARPGTPLWLTRDGDGRGHDLARQLRAPTVQSSGGGLNKGIVLVNRLNIFWGLDWEAVPESLTENHQLRSTDIVIGCVDTRAARAVIERQTTGNSAIHYAIDVGNGESSGQFVLGEPLNAVNRRSRTRLRTAAELFPEIIDATLDDDGQPSCSALQALDRQHSFVNTLLAQHALALLAQLFRYGQISHHGGFVDVASSRAVPLAVDPLVWTAFHLRRFVLRRSRCSCRA